MFRIERRRLTKPSLLHPGELWCSACRSLSQLSACICPWPFWSRNASTPLDVLKRYKKDALNLHWLSLYLFGGLFVCCFLLVVVVVVVFRFFFFFFFFCSKGMPFYSSCSCCFLVFVPIQSHGPLFPHVWKIIRICHCCLAGRGWGVGRGVGWGHISCFVTTVRLFCNVSEFLVVWGGGGDVTWFILYRSVLFFLFHSNKLELLNSCCKKCWIFEQNLRTTYTLLMQEFRRMEDASPQAGDVTPASPLPSAASLSDFDVLVAHLCGQLYHFLSVRQKMMDLYPCRSGTWLRGNSCLELIVMHMVCT